MRIPTHQLVLGPEHLPGCSLETLLRLLYGSLSDERPLEVVPLPGGLWRVLNGRHRYLVAVISGAPDVECREQP